MPEHRPDERPDERPEERDERPGRSPGGRARLLVALLLALAGFGLVTQARATAQDDQYAGFRQEDLVDVLTGLAETAERADGEIDRLEATREELRDDSLDRSAALGEARDRARSVAVLAGTVPVAGPGIRITVAEGEGGVSVGSMLDTVQELRTSRAEAIEIDGRVRLVASSAIGDSLRGLEVDGTVLTAPYEIEAIGEPATLEGGLTFTGGPVDTLEEEGARVQVEVLDRVEIDSVRDGRGAAGSGVDRDGSGQ